MFSVGLSSGLAGGRCRRLMLEGTCSLRVVCQPALSSDGSRCGLPARAWQIVHFARDFSNGPGCVKSFHTAWYKAVVTLVHLGAQGGSALVVNRSARTMIAASSMLPDGGSHDQHL